MSLAIFDLDNTLLAGDSDYLWTRFLIEKGIVDAQAYERENERFFREYEQGTLDIYEFLRFQLRPLAEHDLPHLHAWRDEFLQRRINPIMLPAAHELLDRHRRRGDTLLIVTATNRFITQPIAERFGVEHLLATEPEMVNGRYTGNVSGVPCYREGKVERLQRWLVEHDQDLSESWFYTDSQNDIPLLEEVANPVAVDPDPTLEVLARERGWQVISLRDQTD